MQWILYGIITGNLAYTQVWQNPSAGFQLHTGHPAFRKYLQNIIKPVIEGVADMIRPMFGYRAKAKRFNYKPRYYDPKKEKYGSNRINIKRSYRKTHQGRSVLVYALALAFVVWLITVL